MAIRRSMNVDHYKAQQAKPLFLAEPPSYVTRPDWFDRVLWALAALAVCAAGFCGVAYLLLVL